MYGLANIAIEQLVISRFGDDVWKKIKVKAGVQIESFSRMSPYPDEITYALMQAATEVTGVPMDPLLTTFGEYWVQYTGSSNYGYLFDLAGTSLVEFLSNLDNLHSRVGQNFPKLVPPSFRIDEEGPGSYRLHYHSERQGLCPIVVGVVTALAARFKTKVDMVHPICKRTGADHCEFLLTVDTRNE